MIFDLLVKKLYDKNLNNFGDYFIFLFKFLMLKYVSFTADLKWFPVAVLLTSKTKIFKKVFHYSYLYIGFLLFWKHKELQNKRNKA